MLKQENKHIELQQVTNKLTGFLFGKSSHKADDTVTRNLHEEFENLTYSQVEVSNSTLSQGEVVKDITLMDSNCQQDTQIETIVYRLPEGDVSSTQDGLVPIGSDYSVEGSYDDFEDVVVHDGEIPGRDDQTLNIHDFAEREYQAQLDTSSHEIEASSSSLSLAS